MEIAYVIYTPIAGSDDGDLRYFNSSHPTRNLSERRNAGKSFQMAGLLQGAVRVIEAESVTVCAGAR